MSSGILSLSKHFNDKVMGLIDRDPFAYVSIDCTFRSANPDENEWQLPIRQEWIDSLYISQNFLNNYLDHIELVVDLAPMELIAILRHKQDLRCILRFRGYNPKTVTHSPMERSYPIQAMAIMVNEHDILKEANFGDMTPTDRTPLTESMQGAKIQVTFQLIDPIGYALRKRKINFIARDMDMTRALLYGTSLFGVNQISLPPVDNNRKLENFIIPPMKGITNYYNYLQSMDDGGVFAKGISYYYFNDVMYIYPTYETYPKLSPYTVHVYQVGDGTLTGCDSYHSVSQQRGHNDMHFIANIGSHTETLATKGAENEGTAYLIAHLENIVDKWRDIGDNTFDVHRRHTSLMTVQARSSMVRNEMVYTADSKFSHENTERLAETLYSTGIDLVQTGWMHAIPGTFRPGWRVAYHYDGDHVHRKRSGICQVITYSYTKPEKQLPYHVCSANMTLFLSPVEELME